MLSFELFLINFLVGYKRMGDECAYTLKMNFDVVSGKYMHCLIL